MRNVNPAGGVPATVELVSDEAWPLDNALLRALGEDAASAIIATGRRGVLAAGQALWRPGQDADTIGFPLKGLVAGLATHLDGSTVQVECIGIDSAAGLIEGMAAVPSAFEHRALVDTVLWFVPAEVVRARVRACPAAADVLHRHVARLYDDARRASACAARHPLRERLADSLLGYSEKTALARLPLTQEALSAALGANRTTVTALAIALSQAGLTRTGRGWISVVDAERLDRLACGCRKAGALDPIGKAPAPG